VRQPSQQRAAAVEAAAGREDAKQYELVIFSLESELARKITFLIT
jgi:hypothetical protein